MANVSQLQPSLTPQVQITSNEAPEKDADFLALRLINKRARLRLSPAPLDLTSIPGKASLFAIANSKGWFAAVTRDADGVSALVLSPLADLRAALVAASAEDEQPYTPRRRIPITGALPHILTFACNYTRILLGLVDGSIHVYTSDQLLSGGEGPVQPIHVFAAPPVVLLSLQPNPGDIPELVAVLRDCTNSPGSLAVELFDVQRLTSFGGWMAGKSPSTTPTSISWSPKGKQLALGLQSGDIVTFSPSATATPKSCIPHPLSVNNMGVISVYWLSTSSFHTIYAPPGQLTPESEQVHFHVSLDSKSNSVQATKFNNPYLPYPGLRPPGEFLVSLRGWDPSKVLFFIGDSTSSDIGLIGSVANDFGERWHNFTLEETSTPSLPLDKDQNDTVLLGMDIDLTSSESYRHSTASGEAVDLPAHPIMYVYASDGTILGWHVLNITGASYPGMIGALNAVTPALNVPPVPSGIVRASSSDMQTTPTISPTASAPAEAAAIKPPSTGFGQPSTFGAQVSAFGQASAFSQIGFSQQSTSVFGETSPFGQSATTPSFGSTTMPALLGQPSKPAFESVTSFDGFGAFSSAGPAKFGQPTFSFGGQSQSAPTSTPVPEESMAADNVPSFGGLSLGTANSQDADSKPSIFVKPSVPVSSSKSSTDGILIKPGTGFGAFGGFDQKSPFAAPTAFSSTQHAIGTIGFGAFASGNQSAFAVAASKNVSSEKPVWATGDSSKPLESNSFGEGKTTSALGKPTESSEARTPLTPPVFVKPASGAFGEVLKDSPFFAPKPPESKPASVFTLSLTPGNPTLTPPRVSSAQPAFGVSSMPGAEFQNVQAVDSKREAGFGAFDKSSAFPSTQQPAATFGFGAFASSAQSAFAVAASQSGPSVKPVWATGNSPKPVAESPELKTPSLIPSKTTTPPSFTTASASSVASHSAIRDSIARDDDSRSPSPTSVQSKVTTSNAFSSSAPGPSTGAFSNLQTMPSAFVKPASGIFGELPKDSPFFTPKPPESKPVSVFALSATSSTPASTPPKGNITQPAFGATSMPGVAFKGTFPSVTTAPAQPAPASSASAFSAFSSSGSGFTTFSSGGSKSFSDLLRSTGEEKLSGVEVTPTKPAQVPLQPSISTTPTREPSRPVSAPPVAPPPEEVSKTIEAETSRVSTDLKEKAAETVLIQEPSLESISSSTSSSFVKVSVEEEGGVAEVGAASEAELQEETESLPSSGAPSESEESKEGSEESEGEESETPEEEVEGSENEGTEASSKAADKEEVDELAQKELDPTEIPLPTTPAPARSPSTTPKAEHPKIAVSVSQPSQTPSPSIVPRVSPVGDPGTTPPGSPVKDTTSVPVQMPVPTLKAPPPPTPHFGPTPRPNNRPMRSSPLASSSLVLEGEVEKPPKSAPPVMVAQPAASKAFFSQWTPSTPPFAQPTDDSTHSETPPILFPTPEGKPVPSIFALTTTPPVPSVFTPPGKITTTATEPMTIPGPSPALLSIPTSLPSFMSSNAIPCTRAPLSFTPPLTKTPAAAPTPTSSPEQGMQAECVLLLSTLSKELDNLKQLATAALTKTAELKKTSGIAHQRADLSDPRKWTFGDIKEYGRVLVDVQADIKELKSQRVLLRKDMKELDSNMLKINTRKEEIVRFSKAKTDVEFAKMLKIRTLAPEYSETQSQLRKNIRVIKDRVQKLEDHLQASKKRINEFRTGRPSIKPPSLDTVNRTFRNIDIAISQQKQEISQLRNRMMRLEISGGLGTRDQLAVSPSVRPMNVTSDVAITTAAALNAERSARRLKKALLASRTQPLLNTTAMASPVPTSFQTPQKLTGAIPDAQAPELKTSGSLFSQPTTPTPMMGFPSSLASWTPPPPSEIGSPPLHDITPSRNRGGLKHHQKPIMLKKNASPGGPTQPSPFEWKPVEPIKPVSSLPFALRPVGSSE